MGEPSDIFLVYDKQCPVCDTYCNLVQVRESAGRLRLLDARDGGKIMDRITAAGLDIDEGMVLIVGNEMYYGDEAIHRLALLGTRSGLFNRVAGWAFGSRRRARLLYPVLKAGRGLLLKILRRSRVNNLGIAGNDRF